MSKAEKFGRWLAANPVRARAFANAIVLGLLVMMASAIALAFADGRYLKAIIMAPALCILAWLPFRAKKTAAKEAQRP